jgi:hypothetical protein
MEFCFPNPLCCETILANTSVIVYVGNGMHAVSHAEVCEEHSRHDEIRETVCFTRRANYTITGTLIIKFLKGLIREI